MLKRLDSRLRGNDSGTTEFRTFGCRFNKIKRDENMKVTVHDNQIEKALRDLKKKLTKEGFFSEIKERRFYDKPSVQKKKKRAKAAKRRRKRMRRVY
jgi:small subunit ribosomal protein S21